MHFHLSLAVIAMTVAFTFVSATLDDAAPLQLTDPYRSASELSETTLRLGRVVTVAMATCRVEFSKEPFIALQRLPISSDQ